MVTGKIEDYFCLQHNVMETETFWVKKIQHTANRRLNEAEVTRKMEAHEFIADWEQARVKD